MKQALIDTTVLAFPVPGQVLILDTDASDVACGAVLSTVTDGVEKPIAFFSRVLNTAQRNYCPTRRELLAVVAALQHFRHYLLRSAYHSPYRSPFTKMVKKNLQTTLGYSCTVA